MSEDFADFEGDPTSINQIPQNGQPAVPDLGDLIFGDNRSGDNPAEDTDGTGDSDTIDGGDGNDTIYPSGGSDRVNGSGGNDHPVRPFLGLVDLRRHVDAPRAFHQERLKLGGERPDGRGERGLQIV